MPYVERIERRRDRQRLSAGSFSGKSAPDRKKIGITRKFMISWKPCMFCSVEPIAVPSAANTTAISAMNSERERQRRGVRRPESGNQADDHDQQPLDDRDGRAAERAADHDLQARHRRDERFLQEPELAVPQQADAGEDRREQHRHADDARRDELQVAALARPSGRPGRGRSRAPAGRAAAGRATRQSARATANSASVRAARECRSRSSVIASTSSRPGASGRPSRRARRESSSR